MIGNRLQWVIGLVCIVGIVAASGAAADDAGIIKAYKQFLDGDGAGSVPVQPDQATVPAGEGYVVGVGDILGISVWKDDALTRQVTVLPDSTISFPLIGRLKAGGLTLDQVRAAISERLSRFIPDPVISIDVMRINSLMIYVIGKVNRPGRFELAGNINVLQALALAGGLNPYAKSGKVKIFRESGTKTAIMPFNYDAVTKGRGLEQNIVLGRGDVVVVP